MELPPRKPDAPILGKLGVWRIVFVSFLVGGLTFAIFNYMQSLGADQATSRTVAVNTLVSGQLFYLFNCRKIQLPSLGKGFFNNKNAFIAVAVLIILQLLFSYTPFMNDIFDTINIRAAYWLPPLLAGLAVFFIVELEKFIVVKVMKKKV